MFFKIQKFVCTYKIFFRSVNLLIQLEEKKNKKIMQKQKINKRTVVTRNSGMFIPGQYTKIKIIPASSPPKRKYSKITNIPGLLHFKNELQVLILKNLKAKGGCLRRGIFVISKEIENF